jgi:hypothetical protein
MKANYKIIFFLFVIVLLGCSQKPLRKKKILAIPVYGQSLALGEEATLITNFDTLIKVTNHRVVSQHLDEDFGYFSDNEYTQRLKKMFHIKRRTFELSIYGMSEVLTKYFEDKGYGDSVILSTFPGGIGSTSIVDMSKGSKAYNKFLKEIKLGYSIAKSNGWEYEVPAFCWMQGENDVVWGTSKNYKKDLKQFQIDLNNDIKAITNQTRNVICICYQTNCLTLNSNFDSNNFSSTQLNVPQAQLDLIRTDTSFVASGPTYPYSFVNDRVHIDGISQKRFGYLAGLSAINVLESKPNKGLVPQELKVSKDTVIITFNIPHAPLVLDTVLIKNPSNYGFSVIDSSNNNIIKSVSIQFDKVVIVCKTNPIGSKVRYAVNGMKNKSGQNLGPRGNLRGLPRRCFFCYNIKSKISFTQLVLSI